jgi:hypothetical protein
MGHKYFNSHTLFIFLSISDFVPRSNFYFFVVDSPSSSPPSPSIVSVTEHPEEMELLSVKKFD